MREFIKVFWFKVNMIIFNFPVILALTVTLIVESLVGIIYARRKEYKIKLLIAIVLGNLITIPLVWLFFPELWVMWLAVPLSQISAVIIEAVIIKNFVKNINYPEAFLISVLINVASYLTGEVYYTFSYLLI